MTNIICDDILIKNLTVSYREVSALSHISCTIRGGKLTGIIGPNGAGKSTLMKAMLGLIPVNEGEVIYRGKPIKKQLDQIAYVPQRSLIDWTFPAIVWDVVMMSRVKKTGWLQPFSNVSRQLGIEALDRVGMSKYRNRPIGELSGGQQQRVFLARAIAQQPDILFLDEPFVGIDQKTETLLFEIFGELVKEGKTLVVVNHDLGESITHFEDLLLLNRELISWGNRQIVLRKDNINKAYGGSVAFFGDRAA